MNKQSSMQSMQRMSYKKLGITVIISFLIMYFIMFLNVDSVEHYHTSLTRIYMALLMVSAMTVLMMLSMGKMYPNKKINTAIIFSSILIFILVLAGLRTQTPISDIQYMKAMIPHHSSAIMVSKHANLTDPDVKKLSMQIIKSQEAEISEMEIKIRQLEER